MTWAAWRVQRPQLVAAVAAAVLLGIWLWATGVAMGHNQTWKYWTDGDTYVLYVLPAVLGLAVGAPVVAGEIAHGTNRLAWSQSVTRTRWLVFKLLVGGIASAGIVAALSVLLQWWTTAVSLGTSTNAGGLISGSRIQPPAFDVTGFVVVGYALFAFLLGTALGALIRRPGWAFAAGIPVYGFCRVVVQDWLRPRLVAPAIYSHLLPRFPGSIQRSWILNSGFVPAGRTSPAPGRSWAYTPSSYTSCSYRAQTSSGQAHCAVMAHVHFVIQFQPESHYWALQGAETAVFIALAAVLLGVTVVAVRRWAT